MLPETSTVAAAIAVAGRHLSPALLQHSVRTYVWGSMYGTAHAIAHDEELFGVAALLHDIALSPSFDSHTVPFEEAGGDLARVFARGAGWPAGRADRVAEVIVLHMRGDVAPEADPEAHLLQVASSWEVVGRHWTEFPPGALGATLERYPRLDFGAEFLRRCAAQAARTPARAAAASVRDDLAGRMAGNPLDAWTAGNP